MACFTVPLTTAVIITAARNKIPTRLHINWLLYMLWGGVAWLIPEHIYHGEVVWYPPFFTAGWPTISHEIILVGVPMVLSSLLLWLTMLTLAKQLKKKIFSSHPLRLMVIGVLLMIVIDLIFK